MHFYIVRHGLAVPIDENPDCPLSETGRRDVARMASFLARTRPKIGRIIHSGKTRAAQTALIYAETLGPGRLVEEALDGLSPNDPTEPVVRAAEQWTDDTMVVSHLPLVGKLVARLVTGNEDESVVHFQPGTVACLERGDNGGGWTVAWALGPDLMGG
ncbi:MAG: phosphohistidine phosphatase SixA [Rhodospirillaceae bacterium]